MEAASVAWHPLGWTPVAFSEIEPFPCAILKHRFPNTPNYGSLTEYQSWPVEQGAADLLVGGTPCQSFSVAGLRKGLADPRGNLALTFLGLADKLKPRWIVWENVPGVLSSGGGRDFGSFLGALVELGYGFAYRVLDAQYFGVPQRRRRVFVVACLGDWRAPSEVLSLREGLRGHLEAGNKKRKGPSADAGAGVVPFRKSRRAQSVEDYETWVPDETSNTLNTFDLTGEVRTTHAVVRSKLYENHPNDSRVTGPLDVAPTVVSRFGTGGGNIPLVQHIMPGSVAPTVTSSGPPYSRTGNERVEAEALAITTGIPNCEVSGTLRANPGSGWRSNGTPVEPVVMTPMAVRRLTPVECERLQGFPDNWSRISWKGKPEEQCPDGPRYKACGNSMAVPVMRWIGERIAAYELSQNHETK
jgi:DNA (cytosine-5)-methyltransferase 1